MVEIQSLSKSASTPGSDVDSGLDTINPSPNCSPSRVKHVSSLTINVQSTMGWKPQAQALQERTNSVDFGPTFAIVSPSVDSPSYTPDTSYTFGVPNPTNYSNSPSTSASSFGSPNMSCGSPQPLSPPPRVRPVLQPYTVPSSFNHPRSQKAQPRTSASSRAMSRSFSLTPTVASSVSQSTVTLRIPSPSNSQTKVSFRHPSTSTTCAPDSAKLGFSPWRGDTMSRRQRRYTVAESSLSSSLTHLIPLQDRLASPSHVRQREKDALEKAMAVIDERAREEREELERLMRSMKDGNESGNEYRERRKERWRVEKSLEVLGDERKVLEERCKALMKADPGCDGGARNGGTRTSRMERNLQLFLSGASSPTRAAFRQVSMRPGGRHRNHLSVPNVRPRRMTVSGVQPMKLRRMSVQDTFAEILKVHAKRNSNPTKLEPGQELHSLSPSTTDTSHSITRQSLTESITKPPSLTSVMEDDELLDDQTVPDSSLDLDDSPISPDTGTALIFRHHLLPRDIDDYDIKFELPAYVKDLFTQFDRDRGTVDVGLAIQSQETLSSPTPTSPFRTPRKYRDLPNSPSPSKQLGNGLLMSRSSLFVPDGDDSPSASRPVSFADSMSSRTPEGSSHDLRAGDRNATVSSSPTLGNRLRRKLSKRIFKKW